MLSKTKMLAFISFSLFSTLTYASQISSHSEQYVVVAPECLIQQTAGNYKTLSTNHHFALLEVNNDGIEELMAVKRTQKKCGGFMDVTQQWKKFTTKTSDKNKTFLEHHLTRAKTSSALTQSNYTINYEPQVKALLKQINSQDMWNDLTLLTSFPDRFARSDNGVNAANWIKNQVETMAKNANRDDVFVYTIKTSGSYKQPSVVAKIGNTAEAGIVIGAHMDTYPSKLTHKPGADDDGSGTVNVLEVARVLLSSDMRFKKPIYLIWYSAEEEGLVGSSSVVADFQENHVPIDAVMQLDMTGYAYKNESTLWLMDDYVNPDLTNYLELLINTYIKKPVQHSQCGYGCSDHASWTEAGFKASFPFESSFENDNPEVHNAQDTMDNLSLSHMTDYTKLAVAFAVELGEPLT